MKILIIEDDIMLADLLEEALLSIGHDVCGIACNVADGLRLIYQHRPQVVTVDMHLGKEVGSDVILQLSPTDRHGLGVLYITGCADRVPPDLGHGILIKPYTLAALENSVVTAAALAVGNLDAGLMQRHQAPRSSAEQGEGEVRP